MAIIILFVQFAPNKKCPILQIFPIPISLGLKSPIVVVPNRQVIVWGHCPLNTPKYAKTREFRRISKNFWNIRRISLTTSRTKTTLKLCFGWFWGFCRHFFFFRHNNARSISLFWFLFFFKDSPMLLLFVRVERKLQAPLCRRYTKSSRDKAAESKGQWKWRHWLVLLWQK